MAQKISEPVDDLNLPPANLKIIRQGNDGPLMIFDPQRGKTVVLTPEEYVRQRFTAWLRTHLGYPQSHIANEVQISLNGTVKRCDTIIYSRTGNPLMVIEYKAPYVKITKEVFEQIYRYNLTLHAKYLAVSNGMAHYCCKIDYSSHSYSFLPDFPHYSNIDNHSH